jgi:hypothetical protein
VTTRRSPQRKDLSTLIVSGSGAACASGKGVFEGIWTISQQVFSPHG